MNLKRYQVITLTPEEMEAAKLKTGAFFRLLEMHVEERLRRLQDLYANSPLFYGTLDE